MEKKPLEIFNDLSRMFPHVPVDQLMAVGIANQWNVQSCHSSLTNTYKEVTKSNLGNWDTYPLTPNGAIPKKNKKVQNQLKKENSVFNKDEQRIIELIKSGMRVMVIMRGVPGCGKSTLALALLQHSVPLYCSDKEFILSSDDYFYDKKGRYNYNVALLSEAHNFNQRRVIERAKSGWSPIFVDNTNIKLWEMLPYVKTGVRNNYIIELLEPKTAWRSSAKILAAKNKHDVPQHKIKIMLNSFEKASLQDLLAMIREKTIGPPLMRTAPTLTMGSNNDIVNLHDVPWSGASAIINHQNDEQFGARRQTFQDVSRYSDFNPLANNWNAGTSMQHNREPLWAQQSGAAFQNHFKYTTEVEANWLTNIPMHNIEAPRAMQPNQTPIHSNQQARDQQTDGQPQSFQNDSNNSNFDMPCNTSPPKAQRTKKKSKMGAKINDDHDPDLYRFGLKPIELTGGATWERYKQVRTSTGESKLVLADPDDTNIAVEIQSFKATGKTLLELLRDDTKTEENTSKDPAVESEITFQKHSVNCPNENTNFAYLRQIYPNKNVAALWDLFVKCNGYVDWAADILVHDNEPYENTSTDKEQSDIFECDCSNPKSAETLNSTTASDGASASASASVIKPQRQKNRVQRLNPELQEVKESIENRFVLGDEHYTPHIRMIRGMRNEVVNTSDIVTKNPNDKDTQTEQAEQIEDEQDQEENSYVVEVLLGKSLIQQLHSIFKDEITLGEHMPEDIDVHVFMSRSRAKELYMLWMESLYNELEEKRQISLHDDEDFARLLKNPKYEHYTESPPNVTELLDKELAMMIHNNANQKDEKIVQDLAEHISVMRLSEQFPDIPHDTLEDIYAAYGKDYHQTMRVLRRGGGGVPQQLSSEKAATLNQKTDVETVQKDTRPSYGPTLPPEEAKRLALKNFEETRNLAAHYCQLKAECYQKAKEAIQKGNGDVAVYYSQIANFHKTKIDMYNHRAANSIMDVHKYTQNNPDLLDLHYLHVLEALACLDLFLDRHITGLRNASRSYKYVFLITGRGLHSAGGVSAIKNNVKSRLKERNLKWLEVNPGLLKVKIFSATRYSKNI